MQHEAPRVAHPVHQLPPLASSAPEPPQLFPGTAEPGAEETGPRRVRDGGRRAEPGPQESPRSNPQRAVAPWDVWAFVVAAVASAVRALDAGAVAAARRWGLVTPRLLADLGAQGLVEPLPGPAVPPLAAIPVHTGPLRRLMGEHAPCEAPSNDIKNGLDHRPPLPRAGVPPRLGWWDSMFDTIPCGISEVGGVGIGVHPQSVPN